MTEQPTPVNDSFFEGAEKKVELMVDPGLPSLRDRGEAFWSGIMQRAGATILSRISSPACDAYLLSESSLFVFDHKLLMITCGRTCLPEAVLALLDTIPPEKILFLIYERKNEIHPREQPTSFADDVAMLSGRLPGKAYLFGEQHEHHLHLFQLDRTYELEANDVTTELLMYDIDRDVRDALNTGPGGMQGRLDELTGAGQLLHGFQIDDHYFEPSGYSLNALSGDRYVTIHATPTEQNSYVSLETNHDFETDSGPLIKQMLKTFRPRAYDLIRWESGAAPWQQASEYELNSHVTRHLSCGYRVDFMSFFRPLRTARTAVEIPLTHKPS
jgi:S-adenosylmethionine decarboxylase